MGESYWTMNHATEGIGATFPQHQSMGRAYDYDASDSVHRLPFYEEARFTPNLDSIVIDNAAVVTDLMSSAPLSGGALLLSDRLYSLLGAYNVAPHRFFPASVLHRSRLIASGYGVLHVPT